MRFSLWLLGFAGAFAASVPQQQQPLVNSDAMDAVLSLDGSIDMCATPAAVFVPSRIDITPDPPKRGAQLDVAVVGELKETVDVGAYIKVIVKLGIIKLYEGTLDLCEEAGKIGHPCPIEQGHQEVFHSVDIPREVPPGKYDIDVKVFTQNDREMTCLKIRFRM